LELRQLRHFLAVIEAGSLHRAAKTLNLSEPALSKSINRLEKSLQVRLLERGPRGMIPTIFGEAFATHARLIENELGAVVEELEELRGGARGLLRIAIGPTVAALMPKVVEPLLKSYPGTRLLLKEGLFHSTLSAVVHNTVDFGIAPVEDGFDERDLETELLTHHTLTPLVRANHPLLALKELSVAKLADWPWVVTPKHDRSRKIFDSICANNNFVPWIVAETSGPTFILSYLLQSDAIAFLPQSITLTGDGRDFQALPISEFRWQRRLYVIRRRRKTLSPAARMVIREIRKICGEAI
jgi:DNA-binding transcriptional LysR family regulator